MKFVGKESVFTMDHVCVPGEGARIRRTTRG